MGYGNEVNNNSPLNNLGYYVNAPVDTCNYVCREVLFPNPLSLPTVWDGLHVFSWLLDVLFYAIPFVVAMYLLIRRRKEPS